MASTESDGVITGGGEYHALVLAAGAGSRFGGSKLTAAWGGAALIDAALRSAVAAPVRTVVVVTGAHAEGVEAVVAAFVPDRRVTIRSVRCVDHASGMSASLRCGLEALPQDAPGAFIFLGDMPHVPPDLPALLLAALGAGGLAAAPVAHGRLGHPVLIARDLFEGFARAAGDGGGQRVLRDLGDALVTVAVDDPGVLADIDTPADLAQARRTRVTIISGPIRSGKTTRMAAWARGRGDVTGLLSPDGPDGRLFVDLTTGETIAMEGPRPGEPAIHIGRFAFRAAAFDWANARLIEAARDPRCPPLVIDEIGPLELRGGGLHAGLTAALERSEGQVYLVVREHLVDAVRERFALAQAEVAPAVGWPQHGHSASGAP